MHQLPYLSPEVAAEQLQQLLETMERTQALHWRNASISDTPKVQQQAAANTSRNGQDFDSHDVGTAAAAVQSFEDTQDSVQKMRAANAPTM